MASQELCRDGPVKKRLKDLLSKTPLSQTKIGNLCRFYCPECQQEIKSISNFHMHLKKKHRNMSMAQSKMLMMTSSKLVAHECMICTERIVCDNSYITCHLKLHNGTTIEEYCVSNRVINESSRIKSCSQWQEVVTTSKKTDCVDNLCQFKCPDCKITFSAWLHAKEHLKTHSKYTGKHIYGNILSYAIKITLFECRLCNQKVVCDKGLIGQHVKAIHKMSIQKYVDKTGAIYLKKNMKGQWISQHVQEQLSKVELSQKVGNLCKFNCLICKGNYTSWQGLIAHMKDKHNKIGDVNEILSKGTDIMVAHKCILCSKLLLNDTYRIYVHVRSSHGMKSISQYCKLTESKRSDSIHSAYINNPETAVTAPNLCKFKCPCCQEIKTSFVALRTHIKKHHKFLVRSIKYKEYITKTALHECQLCSEEILSDRTFILSHCRSKHGMSSLAEYGKGEPGPRMTKKSAKSLPRLEVKQVHEKQVPFRAKALNEQANRKVHKSALKECRVVLHDIMASSDSECEDLD